MKKTSKGNEISKFLADRLKRLRGESGLSQEELAQKIIGFGGGCTNKYISMLENAKKPISRNMANYLSLVFGIDSNYLLDETVGYKTPEEKHQREMMGLLNRGESFVSYMTNAINMMALANGFEIELKDIGAGARKMLSSDETESGTFKELFENYFILKKDGKEEYSLSYFEFNRFCEYLSKVFMVHVENNIKIKE